MDWFWWYWIILFIIGYIAWKIRTKRSTFGFFITLGIFGSGKTQNTTSYLRYVDKRNTCNITNYYTGYTDFQISSHQDIVNIFEDIYTYNLYFNNLEEIHKLFTHKKEFIVQYLEWFKDFIDFAVPQYSPIIDEFIQKTSQDPFFCYKSFPLLVETLRKHGYFEKFPKNMKFNLVLDEWSIYFNPRNFAKNFSGKNEMLLDFIYQPRKLGVLCFVVCQSPMELDVKFRRLATYYRKYYPWVGFWRWYRDLYFINPEEINLEKAEEVGWWPLWGWFIDLHNTFLRYPSYDYSTKELIRPHYDIYFRGSLFSHLTYIKTLPWPQKRFSNRIYSKVKNLFSSFGLQPSPISSPLFSPLPISDPLKKIPSMLSA